MDYVSSSGLSRTVRCAERRLAKLPLGIGMPAAIWLAVTADLTRAVWLSVKDTTA